MKRTRDFMQEAIPVRVSHARTELMEALDSFSREYAKFEAELDTVKRKGGKGSEQYGSAVQDMNQKVLRDTKKAYKNLEKKWKQFDVSVWAMHLR